MQRLKLIPSLCLLSALIVAVVPSIANAQDMQTAINSLIPTTDVYCDGSYPLVNTSDISAENMNLHQCPPTSIAAVPSNVVDWVLVELRAVTHGGTPNTTNVNSAVGTTVIARKPAFLLNNGRIVETTYTGADPSACTGLVEHLNCPDVSFEEGNIATEVETKDLYVVIRHRNHLDIISNTFVEMSDAEPGVYAYDFTTSQNQARGGVSALKSVSSRFVMYGGDASGDGNVSLSGDYQGFIAPNDLVPGYLSSDLNFDTNTTLPDYTTIGFSNDLNQSQVP